MLALLRKQYRHARAGVHTLLLREFGTTAAFLQATDTEPFVSGNG